jgi:hypothetical protein
LSLVEQVATAAGVWASPHGANANRLSIGTKKPEPKP